MCRPSLVTNFAGLSPPTFATIPLENVPSRAA